MSINDQFTVFWSEWFEAFLTNRNGLKTISSWADPANSVLGTILFIICINNLVGHCSYIILFADDTKFSSFYRINRKKIVNSSNNWINLMSVRIHGYT